MRKEDVKEGMKVVPHAKTAFDDGLKAWAKNNPRHKRFLDENGFLLVMHGWSNLNKLFALWDGVDKESGNIVFNASDFEPATIEVGDTVMPENHAGVERVVSRIAGKQYFLMYECGEGPFSFSVDDLTLVRKARPQEQKEEPKVETVFKVGDRVRNGNPGWGDGTVTSFNSKVWGDRYPIEVTHKNGGKIYYTADGKQFVDEEVVLTKIESTEAPAPALTRVVLVRHADKPGREFLFETSGTLNAGDKVLCATRKGEADGWVLGGSFDVSTETLPALAKAHHATLPLRSIVGAYREELKRF